VREKPTVGSPFFEAFLSGRISKATKDVSVRFFITVAITVIYISGFRDIFKTTAYFEIRVLKCVRQVSSKHNWRVH
jgi:hypothetical protein